MRWRYTAPMRVLQAKEVSNSFLFLSWFIPQNQVLRAALVFTLENGATWLVAPMIRRASLIPESNRLCQRADQVERGIKENPDEIDEVPIDGGCFDRVLFLII